MSLSDLRDKRKKLARKLERRQSIRHKLRKFIRYAKKRGLETLAKQAGKVEKRLQAKVKELHDQLQLIEERIDELEKANKGRREKFVRWVKSKVGVDENGSEADGWARDLGYGDTSAVPWCSIFVGWKLKDLGIPLPANPAYSGAWLNWSSGTRIGYSTAQSGDLLIFDWGDGGITDHVAVYIGSGQMIGGNQRDTNSGGAVTQIPVPAGAIVGVVRPDWT